MPASFPIAFTYCLYLLPFPITLYLLVGTAGVMKFIAVAIDF